MFKVSFNVGDKIFFRYETEISGFGIEKAIIPKDTEGVVVAIVDDTYIKIEINNVVFTVKRAILGQDWD